MSQRKQKPTLTLIIFSLFSTYFVSLQRIKSVCSRRDNSTLYSGLLRCRIFARLCLKRLWHRIELMRCFVPHKHQITREQNVLNVGESSVCLCLSWHIFDGAGEWRGTFIIKIKIYANIPRRWHKLINCNLRNFIIQIFMHQNLCDFTVSQSPKSLNPFRL